MSKITGNEPINPCLIRGEKPFSDQHHTGLTIRQEFAARAMQGLISDKENWPSPFIVSDDISIKEIAKLSIKLADALIEELNK